MDKSNSKLNCDHTLFHNTPASRDNIELSILTPAVPSRYPLIGDLHALIDGQIKGRAVEHLILFDNKRRTVGGKRDALLRMARGRYVAFVDDDDTVSPNYVDAILAAIRKSSPDVVTFLQSATVNGIVANIQFRLGNPNEAFPSRASAVVDQVPIVRRNAWHVCAWRRSLAICSHFPAANYGEDWAYAAPLCELAKTEEHIPEILHYYHHDIKTTEAPMPL